MPWFATYPTRFSHFPTALSWVCFVSSQSFIDVDDKAAIKLEHFDVLTQYFLGFFSRHVIY